MSLQEPIPPLRDRALAMPHMMRFLENIADRHDALHHGISLSLAEKGLPTKTDDKQDYAKLAENAGFIRLDVSIPNRYVIRLTADGYEAIGRKVPLWRK